MAIDTNLEQVLDYVELLHKLAPNWSYAKNILNFGGSDFSDQAEACITENYKRDMTVVSYDWHENLGGEANSDEIDITKRHFCIMFCANVLNTCKDLEPVLAAMAKIDFDCAVIQINDGNRSGKGRKTRDGYQRNEVVADYVPILKRNFHKFDVTLHRSDKCITIVKGRKYYELDDLED
ncbi:hypothetical protein RC861_004268 [Vibrio parahaemolyticus]|nr:hypothetical protein [Vibrio parahaemolyticus]